MKGISRRRLRVLWTAAVVVVLGCCLLSPVLAVQSSESDPTSMTSEFWAIIAVGGTLATIGITCLGHCAKLVCHLWVFWSYWRHEARHRAGSDPCCEVCGGRSRVGRAQSPPVGGGRVARHRLRRRRGGFVGHRCGSGDDSQGAPGDCPRRGADGPHSTPWRRTAPHPAGSTRHPGRAPSAGGSAHARRPDLAAALDVQESRRSWRRR